MSIHKVTDTRTVVINDTEALDDLRKLHGLPPYDGGSNICRDDGYYARSLEKKHGLPLDALERAVGFSAELQRWESARQLFMRGGA